MKITCTQENLKKSIFAVERVVGKKSTLPILENILIEAKGGKVTLSATNLELGVVIHLSAKIEREGRITVPVKILSLFVGNLPSDAVIDISIHNLEMFLVSGNHSAVIQGFDSEDFPLIPRVDDSLYNTYLNAQLFRNALHKNMFAVSPSNIRVEFSGIFLYFDEGAIYMVSTDSFRLIETKLSFQGDAPEGVGQGVILPYQTVSEVIRLVSEDVEKVGIVVQDGQIFFQIGEDIALVSRLIQGSFPDYKQIIPQSFSTNIDIVKEQLLQSIRLALAFLGGTVGEVVFSVDGGKEQLILHTESEKTGKNTSLIPVKISGESMSVVFNPKYVLDAIQVVDGDEIVLSLNSESSPTMFVPKNKQEENVSYRYILMPIKK